MEMQRCLSNEFNMINNWMLHDISSAKNWLDGELYHSNCFLHAEICPRLINDDMMDRVPSEDLDWRHPSSEDIANHPRSEFGVCGGNVQCYNERTVLLQPVLRLIRSTSDVKRYVDCSVKPPSMMDDEECKAASGGDDASRLTASRSVSLPFNASSEEPHRDCQLSSGNTRHACSISGNQSEPNYDVFLGGSCNPTTWRTELAIPQLKKLNISYYNPQMATWHPGMVVLEEAAKESSRVLFFVIDNQTRAVASMVEACYLVASCRKLMLIVNALTNSSLKICDDALSFGECEELNQSRAYISELVEFMGLPLFLSVPAALGSIEQMLHNAIHCRTPLDFEDETPSRTSVVKDNITAGGDDLHKSSKNTLSPVQLRQLCEVFAGGKLLTYDQACQTFHRFTGLKLSASSLTELLPKISRDVTDTSEQYDAICGQSYSRSVDVPRGYVSFRMFCSLCNHVRAGQFEGRLHGVAAGKPNSVMRLYKLLSKSASKVLSKPRHVVDEDRRLQCCVDSVKTGSSQATRSRIGMFGEQSLSCWIEEYANPMIVQLKLSVELVHGTAVVARKPDSALCFMSSCDWIMFSLTTSCRGALLLCLAAHCMGAGFRTVLCLQHLSDGDMVQGEKLSPTAVKDYNRGRTYLKATAEREGVPVFETPKEALQFILEQCSAP